MAMETVGEKCQRFWRAVAKLIFEGMLGLAWNSLRTRSFTKDSQISPAALGYLNR